MNRTGGTNFIMNVYIDNPIFISGVIFAHSREEVTLFKAKGSLNSWNITKNTLSLTS